MHWAPPARCLVRRSLSCLALWEPTTKTRSSCAQWPYSVAVFIRMRLRFVCFLWGWGTASGFHLSLSWKWILTQMHKDLPVRVPCMGQMHVLFCFFKLWCLGFVYRCLTLKIKAASKNMISEVEVKAWTGMPLNQNASRSIQAVTLAVIAWEPLFIKPVRPAYVKTLLSSQCPLPKKTKKTIKTSTQFKDSTEMAPPAGDARN